MLGSLLSHSFFPSNVLLHHSSISNAFFKDFPFPRYSFNLSSTSSKASIKFSCFSIILKFSNTLGSYILFPLFIPSFIIFCISNLNSLKYFIFPTKSNTTGVVFLSLDSTLPNVCTNSLYDFVGLCIISPVISSSCIPSINMFFEYNNFKPSFPLLSNKFSAAIFSLSGLDDSALKYVCFGFTPSNIPSCFACSCNCSILSPGLQNIRYFPFSSKCFSYISFNPFAFSICFFTFLNLSSRSFFCFSSSINSIFSSNDSMSSLNMCLALIYIGSFNIPLATASDISSVYAGFPHLFSIMSCPSFLSGVAVIPNISASLLVSNK